MPARPLPVLDRIARNLSFLESGCWVWGDLDARTYSRVGVGGRTRLAHRVVWEEVVGPIPEGLDIDHLCRNKACVNPDHLEPVTRAENMLRAEVRRAQCPKGHPYEGDNVIWVRRRGYKPSQLCRTCRTEVVRARRRRLKTEEN